MLMTNVDNTINSNSIVEVKCDYCGNITQSIYKNFLKGRKTIDKDSCTHCVGKKCAEITLKKRQCNYYYRLLEVCEQNGYTLITEKEEIKNNKTYVIYICPIHGKHQMRIGNMLSGKKCPNCNYDKASDRFRFTKEQVIDLITQSGGELINPDDYINNHKNNLKIKCPSCKDVFTTSLVYFTQHGGQLCKKCKTTESIGEMRIRIYLENHNIEFSQEYWFDNCRDIKPLPFDFYLPRYNTVIEFDGRQHFIDTNYFTYSFDKVRKHDDIKNKYCMNNNIDIIRIPYTKINHINEILDKKLA